MTRGEAARGGRGRRGRRLAGLLVLCLALGVGEWRLGLYDQYAEPWVDGLFGAEADAPPDPSQVAPPPALDLPPVAMPKPAGRPADGGRLDPSAVRAALAPYLRDRDLGRHVVAAVAPLAARGGPTFTHGRGMAIPASTTKLVTSAAALLVLDPGQRFETTVVRGGGRRVVLVGGGDPFLLSRPADADTPYPARADVVTLARRTAKQLRRQGMRRVRVGYDDSLFSGPAVNPAWEPDYVPDNVVTPISALWVDQGRDPGGYRRVEDPAASAASVFAAALRRAGIETVGGVQRGRADPGGRRLATVRSAPLSQIVERLIDVSDNEATEVVLRHVGLAGGREGSFAAGRRAVATVLRDHGVDLGQSRLYDGSGLSRRNRIEVTSLIDVLRLAASPEHPELRPVITGLPVFAGFHGSLSDDFHGQSPEARGRMRAKTGTLTGVHALAGVAVGPDGVPMAFALLTDRVRRDKNGIAPVVVANAAAALGACRCGALPGG